MSVHPFPQILTLCNTYNLFPKTGIWEPKLCFLVKSNFPACPVNPTSPLSLSPACFPFPRKLVLWDQWTHAELGSDAHQVCRCLTLAFLLASFVLMKMESSGILPEGYGWPTAADVGLLNLLLRSHWCLDPHRLLLGHERTRVCDADPS